MKYTPEDIHVYPLNDLREHITDGPGCPCNPDVKIEGATIIYIHHAWDGREEDAEETKT